MGEINHNFFFQCLALPKDYHLSQHTGNIRDRSRDKERSMSSRSSPPPMMPTRKRSRSPPRRTRSRSRSRSPPRRRARTAPRLVETNLLESRGSKNKEIVRPCSEFLITQFFFVAKFEQILCF